VPTMIGLLIRLFTDEEHETWDKLFARQAKMLPGRACSAFLKGIDVLRLEKSGIPDFRDLNAILMDRTGWQVVAVPGLVPDDVFFDHLANRRFVSGNFIRRRDQLDYLQEPDVFHDVFGVYIGIRLNLDLSKKSKSCGFMGLV